MSLFHKEWSGLHEAAFLLGLFALLSQTMAIIRDRLFASYFGAGVELDVYYAAFRIPDIIFVSIASFVAITVIMPFLIAKYEEGKETARTFLNEVFTVFFAFVVIVSGLVFLAMPSLVGMFFGSMPVEQQDMVVTLSRLLLLSPILLGISNIFASITQSFKKFFVYAVSPVLYNIGIIVGLVVFYPSVGIIGLGYGVILGALLHMLIQVPVVVQHGLMPRITSTIHWVNIKEVLLLALPRTIGLSVHQIALLVLTSLASVMATGAIAVFQLSFNLQSVPLSIIGVSYSVAAFPTLARLISKKKNKEYIRQITTALRHILFWSLPIMALFIVLRAQIVRSILGTGEFDWSDTKLTAAALALFALSVAAQCVVLLLVRGYYAAGNTRTPVITNVLSAGLIIAFAFIFDVIFNQYPLFQYFIESSLRVSDVAGTSMLGLPLAYSVGMILNAYVLWLLFKRDFKIKHTARLQRAFRHSLYAAVTIGAVSYQLLEVLDDIFDTETFIGIFSQGLFAGLGGIWAGIILLRLMKNKEIKEIGRALHNKFWKTKVVGPDKEGL